MASAATAGFGVIVVYSGSTVGELLEVAATMVEKDQIDVTNHASTSGYEEFIPSAIIKTGSFTLKANRVKADGGQVALITAYTNGTSATCSITYPDGTALSGAAFVTSVGFDSPMREQETMSATLKWSGEVTIS